MARRKRSPNLLSPKEQEELDDMLVACVLEGVENPNMRKMLEFAYRLHGLQNACILKDMLLKAASSSPQ